MFIELNGLLSSYLGCKQIELKEKLRLVYDFLINNAISEKNIHRLSLDLHVTIIFLTLLF
jgi:hypothetical protein